MIGILLIATGKYKQFVQPLVDSIVENMLREEQITCFLFTDEFGEYIGNERVKIEQFIIPSYKFPEATLYRYKIFDEHKEFIRNTSHLIYLDVDMRIEHEVRSDEFLQYVISVRHPGFANGGWGSTACDMRSLAYLPPEQQQVYCAGGVQGGATEIYLKACNILHSRIADDERRGVTAVWHDETHFNWILKSNEVPHIPALHSGYCMVEDLERRKTWKIDHLPVKIIALNKNHLELRG